MSTLWTDSWEAMEQKLLRHLCKVLGDEEGVEAFRLDNRPRALQDTGDEGVEWCILLSGGNVDNPRQSRSMMQGGMWEMDGEISVRGTCGRNVRRKAAEILGQLPIDGQDIEGLARCWAVRYPTMERLLEPRGDREGAGEEIIVFYSRIEIRAVFSNVIETEE